MKGQPLVIQPRYGSYLKALPAFIEAMVFSKTVDSANPFYPIVAPDTTTLVPIAPPPIIFDFLATVPEEVIQQLQSRMGDQVFQMVKKGSTGTAYIAKNLTYPNVAELAQTASINTITPAFVNSCNLDGYKGFLWAQRLLQRVLSLHYYPAFADNAHADEYIAYKDVEIDIMEVDVDEFDDGLQLASEDEGTPTPESKVRKGKARIEKKKEGDGRKTWTGPFSAVDEKPGVIPPQDSAEFIYITSTSSLPNNDGLYAPYLSDLLNYDKKFVPDFIHTYLYGCLGSDEAECAEEMSTFRSRWGVVAETESGLKLTHLYMCLKLALDAQARCLPYISNSQGYSGCFILGGGFEIIVESARRQPQGRADLLSGFRLADMHDRGLQEIYQLSGGDGYWNEERKNSVRTMAVLREHLLGAPIQTSSKDQIIQAAAKLDFSEEHLRVHYNDIVKALSILNSGGPIPNDFPIHFTRILDTDRVSVVWSAFGPFAPTFKVVGGRVVELKSMETSRVFKPRIGEKAEKLDARRIGVKTIPLDLAVADLKWVKDEGKIMTPFQNPKGEKRSTEHFVRFISGEGYNAVVAELRQFSGRMIDVGGGPSKRGLELEDDRGVAKKKKRGMEDF